MALALAQNSPIIAASGSHQDPLWDFLRLDTPARIEAPVGDGSGGPLPAQEPAPALTEYTVESGDTVRAIAERFDIDVPTVLGANPSLAANPDGLQVGSRVTILPTRGALATLSDGDTLVRLALRNRVDPVVVAAYNRIPNADSLSAGTQLILPGAQPDLPRVQSGDSGMQQAAAVPEMGMRPLVPAPPVVATGFNPAWPTQGTITTNFGEVGATSPNGHSGLDIAAPYGTSVRAADAGIVAQAGWDTGGYGILVVLDHANGMQTWYGHLSSAQVEAGERVEKGALVGLMGSTGYSTGSHVHFEVRSQGGLRNPLNYLP